MTPISYKAKNEVDYEIKIEREGDFQAVTATLATGEPATPFRYLVDDLHMQDFPGAIGHLVELTQHDLDKLPIAPKPEPKVTPKPMPGNPNKFESTPPDVLRRKGK